MKVFSLWKLFFFFQYVMYLSWNFKGSIFSLYEKKNWKMQQKIYLKNLHKKSLKYSTWNFEQTYLGDRGIFFTRWVDTLRLIFNYCEYWYVRQLSHTGGLNNHVRDVRSSGWQWRNVNPWIEWLRNKIPIKSENSRSNIDDRMMSSDE